MAPVYADHPFKLIQTPTYTRKQENSDFKPDLFIHTATEMAHAHNLMIRGLNAIYLQAPHIVEADVPSFCKYMLGWHTMMHTHHDAEENHLFPYLEQVAGQKIMEVNVEQHRAFDKGLDEFRGYVDAVSAGTEKYDGQRVVRIIDDFGPVLMKHLEEEVPTMAGLGQYGSEEKEFKDMRKILGDLVADELKHLGLGGQVWVFSNVDNNYEGGMWQNWPSEAPAVAKWLVRSVLWRFVHADVAKFGSVDSSGRLRPLYAVPSSE